MEKRGKELLLSVVYHEDLGLGRVKREGTGITRCIQIALWTIAYFFTPLLKIQIIHTGLKDRTNPSANTVLSNNPKPQVTRVQGLQKTKIVGY